jgi:hypothetical protein
MHAERPSDSDLRRVQQHIVSDAHPAFQTGELVQVSATTATLAGMTQATVAYCVAISH